MYTNLEKKKKMETNKPLNPDMVRSLENIVARQPSWMGYTVHQTWDRGLAAILGGIDKIL